MSLIEEALRRVQDPSTTVQAPKTTAAQKTKREDRSSIHPWSTTPQGSPASASTSPKSTTVLLLIAIGILIATSGLIGWGMWWLAHRLGSPTSEPIQSTTQSLTETPVTRPTTSSVVPATQGSSQEAFVLSGVVEGLGEPYAVINGVIVGVGEQLGDATVQEIGHGSVKLRRSNGTETVLRVAR